MVQKYFLEIGIFEALNIHILEFEIFLGRSSLAGIFLPQFDGQIFRSAVTPPPSLTSQGVRVKVLESINPTKIEQQPKFVFLAENIDK